MYNNFNLAWKLSSPYSLSLSYDFQSFNNYIYFRSSRDTDVESEQSLGVQFILLISEDIMAYYWIIWLSTVALVANGEASLYDDDYDTYTNSYDYKSAGKVYPR